MINCVIMTNIDNITFNELSNPTGFDSNIHNLNNDIEIIKIDDSNFIRKNHETEIIHIPDPTFPTFTKKNPETEIIHIDDPTIIKKNPDFSKVEDMKDLVLDKFNINIDSNLTNQNIINLPNPFNKDENNCILPPKDDIIELFNNELFKKDPKSEKANDVIAELFNNELIKKDDNSNIFNDPIFNEPILLNTNNKIDDIFINYNDSIQLDTHKEVLIDYINDNVIYHDTVKDNYIKHFDNFISKENQTITILSF